MGTTASVALIILIIESMLFVSVVLVVMAGMVYAMVMLRRVVKRFMPRAQAFSDQVVSVTRQVCDKVAAPFLWAHATNAHVRTSAKAFRTRVNRLWS
jgi:hypothetical protein